MSDRPFTEKKIEFFEQYLSSNFYSLDALCLLQHELKYRNVKTYPRYRALKARVETRLIQLSEIHEMLAVHFRYPPFHEWFFHDGEKTEIFSSAVTTGSMPLHEADFDSFLLRHNIAPYYLGTDVETLIIGQSEWNPEELMTQLDLRSNKCIKVYSQEMAIAFLGCGKDPFDNGGLLQYFGFGHPGLEFLMKLGFDWPFTHVNTKSSTTLDINWPKQGLLSYMGYIVGEKGIPTKERREILRKVFEANELPKVNSKPYMDQWGKAQSTERLYKLANSIAAFAKNAKRNNPERYALSIKHWESDLQWLKDNFYTGHFWFSWPATFVGNEYKKEG